MPIAPAPKGRQSLSRVRRELSDEEFATPAVVRMMIEDLERLEREVADLKDYRAQYHSADKRADILAEKAKRSLADDLVFGVGLAIGSAALGYAPALWDHQPSGTIALVFGSALILGCIGFKAIRR